MFLQNAVRGGGRESEGGHEKRKGKKCRVCFCVRECKVNGTLLRPPSQDQNNWPLIQLSGRVRLGYVRLRKFKYGWVCKFWYC